MVMQGVMNRYRVRLRNLENASALLDRGFIRGTRGAVEYEGD